MPDIRKYLKKESEDDMKTIKEDNQMLTQIVMTNDCSTVSLTAPLVKSTRKKSRSTLKLSGQEYYRKMFEFALSVPHQVQESSNAVQIKTEEVSEDCLCLEEGKIREAIPKNSMVSLTQREEYLSKFKFKKKSPPKENIVTKKDREEKRKLKIQGKSEEIVKVRSKRVTNDSNQKQTPKKISKRGWGSQKVSKNQEQNPKNVKTIVKMFESFKGGTENLIENEPKIKNFSKIFNEKLDLTNGPAKGKNHKLLAKTSTKNAAKKQNNPEVQKITSFFDKICQNTATTQ